MTRVPVVWLLVTDKTGDNQQAIWVANLASEQLNWDIRTVSIGFSPPWDKAKPPPGSGIAHMDPSYLSLLKPPWPDIIITIGRRPASVAQWIRLQAGNAVKIILIGKPSGVFGALQHRFALVILNRQHSAPPMANTLVLDFPLIAVCIKQLAKARDYWSDRFSAMPRPLVGVLIGGETSPYVFNRALLNGLLQRISYIRELGGTAVVSTSRRTASWLIDSLQERTGVDLIDARLSLESVPNPHLALMAEADGLIVTEDSISMQVESIRLGKPLTIFSLPLKKSLYPKIFFRQVVCWINSHWPGLSTLLARCRCVLLVRNYRQFHRYLYRLKLASNDLLNLDPPGALPENLENEANQQIVSRLRLLWDDENGC